ncbi:MAG: peptidoglycan-binding protein [Flavobacteriaceae bacterium]
MFNFARPDDGLDDFIDVPPPPPELVAEERAPLRGPARAGLGMLLGVGRIALTGPAIAAAMMLGVATNAAFLQEGKHPAPLLGEPADTEAAAAPQPRADPTPETVASIPLPQARPDHESAGAALPPAPQARPVAVGPRVVELQKLLAALGYYDGTVDGIAGPRTQAAIRRYEAAEGLVETGDVNAAIADHARLSLSRREAAAATPMPVVAEAPAIAETPVIADEGVAEVQRILSLLGYAPGTIDGRMSDTTAHAIARFRTDRDLPGDGRIDEVLLRELEIFSGFAIAPGA